MDQSLHEEPTRGTAPQLPHPHPCPLQTRLLARASGLDLTGNENYSIPASCGTMMVFISQGVVLLLTE